MVAAQNLLKSSAKVAEHHDYLIEESPSTPFLHETHPLVFRLSNTVPWFFWGCYLLVQASFIWCYRTPSTAIKLCLWTGWIVECSLCFVDFNWALDAILPMRMPMKQKRRPHYRLLDDTAPSVDVFVTCCGEPLEIIMNSVRAAATLNYPWDKFNVVLLDDGHDENLRAAVESLNSSGDHLARVYYRSRKIAPNTRSFFKAGNLNFGIQETKQLSNSEFLASLDADIIISEDFLRKMLPNLILDTKTAMATSPQNYYNVPKGDPLAQQAESTIWNTIFQPIHDHVGEATCQGTGFIVRRAALEQIGGWPQVDTGEDYMCSAKLVEKGWKIAFVRENFQHGIVPESFRSRVKQRLRWIDAAFEGHKNNGWYLTNNVGDGVTLADRATSLLFVLRDLVSFNTLWCLVMLPTILALGLSNTSSHMPATSHYHLLNTLLVLAWTSSKICDWIIYHRAGLSHLSNLQSMDIWAAPYCATRCISHLFSSLTGVNLTFFVTGSFVCPINERNPALRAPLFKRLTTFGIPMHVIYPVLSTLIITHCIRTISAESATGTGTAPPLLPGHVLQLARCAWKMSVPAVYIAFPPSVPEWHALLQRDGNGVLRPRIEFPSRMAPDQRGGPKMSIKTRAGRDALELAVMAGVLGGSFIGVW